MRRKKALKGGRAFPVLVAGIIGYLIGGWHPAAMRATEDVASAQSFALRFPQQWNSTSPVVAAAAPQSPDTDDTSDTSTATANILGDAQLALLNPAPMVSRAVPHAQPQGAPQPAAENVNPQPGTQIATVETTGSLPAAGARALTPQAAVPVANPVKTPAQAKPPTIEAKRRVEKRPGYMLDDAQIASIRERLHLTPDQEEMWPAVEAALRNLAYARAREAARRGGTQTAEVDPEAVAGLKSAAVPLIMSFDDEQKQEVRNLAHVMGLDQLASQF